MNLVVISPLVLSYQVFWLHILCPSLTAFVSYITKSKRLQRNRYGFIATFPFLS